MTRLRTLLELAAFATCLIRAARSAAAAPTAPS